MRIGKKKKLNANKIRDLLIFQTLKKSQLQTTAT